MWRSYYMTFTGEYRGGHDDHHGHAEHGHGAHEPHESPRTMSWVLATLALLIIPTAALGFWPLLHITPLFERWLHPVVGRAMESLSWRSATEHVFTLEVGLAAASVGISLCGWLVARALYKDDKSSIPQRLLATPSWILRAPHTLIYNKYFVDEGYDWLVVRRTRQLSRILFWFDQKIVDGLVNLAGFLGRLVSAIDGLIDALVVDGMVNGVAGLIGFLGRRVRTFQTGRIQTYLAGAIVGALLLVVINFLLLVD
jgi:NADH-quinone oxidoreductase subunit L